MQFSRTPRGRARWRAVAAAVAVSAAVHILIIGVFVRDWDGPTPPMRDDTITLALDRPPRPPPPPPPPPPEKTERARALPPPPDPLARPTETEAPPVLTPGRGDTPTLASGSGGNGRTAPAPAGPDRLTVPCLGKNRDKMSPLRRQNCEQELIALAVPSKLPPGALIPPDAKADFDKGREMRGCLVPHPQGGCVDDKGVSASRKF